MQVYLSIAIEFEKRLGLPGDFFTTLIAEDDWSFVVKTHALVEACLTHAICAVLRRPELQTVVAHLDTANNQSGKLAFAKALGLLSQTHRRYIVTLSQLRNELVHNVQSTSFTFENYWNNLTADRHLQICAALALDDEPLRTPEQNELKLISFVNECPKLGIGYATAIVLTGLYEQAIKGELAVELERLGSAVLEQISEAYREAKNAP
jgi:hypothetical protein